MAKHDDARARGRIDQQYGLAQNNLDNLRNDMVIPQAQQMWNNYSNAAANAFHDYGDLMGGYKNFAATGGYSPSDLSAIRARSVSPIRAIYANANREVDRGKSLSGYSPNFNASKAKMAREQSYALSDAQTGVESNIAQMINEGKRYGLTGGTSLYGASPGMASTFGNQALGATRNWLDTQQLQNQLGLGTMNAQIQAGHLPGNWENTMGRIKDIAGIGSNLMNVFGGGGLKNMFGGGGWGGDTIEGGGYPTEYDPFSNPSDSYWGTSGGGGWSEIPSQTYDPFGSQSGSYYSGGINGTNPVSINPGVYDPFSNPSESYWG